jgi:hypothetical protein
MISTLDVIQESFEDVSLDYNPKPSASSRFYGINRQNSVSNNNSNIKLNYSTSSINNNSSKELLLTPSQKLKIIKKQRLQKSVDQLSSNSPENLNSIDFLSDDELPDNLIVYDVPSLYSLQTLSTNRSKTRKPSIRRKNSLSSNSSNETTITNTHNISRQIDNTTMNNNNFATTTSTILTTPHYNNNNNIQPPNWRHIHSSSSTSSNSSTMSSPATRASSIFSKSSDVSEFRDSEDDVLSPLSKEVKLLSQNKDMKLEETLQRMSILKNLSHLNTQNSLNGNLNIPKIDNSNIKLNYLSSTRQSNLPPKTKYEILKHEKDYQIILQTEIHNEHEKLKQYQLKKKQLLIRNEKDEKLWNKVINNYNILIKLPQTRELWWRSLPDKYRSKIWKKQLISKKKVIFTDDQFSSALFEADKIIDNACSFKLIKDELIRKQKQSENSKILEQIKLIEKFSEQIQFSFPQLNYFQNGETFDSILKMLIAFNNLKSNDEKLNKVDIFKLINLLCTLFYVFNDELITLNCFISLILKKLPNFMLISNNEQIPSTLIKDLEIEKSNNQSNYLKDIKDQFDKYLLQITPNLYNHFIQRDVNSLKIIQSLTCCIFSNQLPFDVILRVLDIYLFEGDIFLLRVSLALLKKVSFKLFGSKDEIYKLTKVNVGEFESNNSDVFNVGEVEEFIKDIREVLKKGKS